MTHKTVWTVMKSGGEYSVEHVLRLRAQAPDLEFKTLSDVNFPGSIPLVANYPGWWAKMELMRPDIPGDIFYMDLDTNILGDIRLLLHPGKTTFLSDFYRPESIQSSMFYMTKEDRARVWAAWTDEGAANVIARFRQLRAGFNGDQNYIQEVLGTGVRRWQNDYPGLVQSYKVNFVKSGLHPLCRVMIFHGKPRPWHVPPEVFRR